MGAPLHLRALATALVVLAPASALADEPSASTDADAAVAGSDANSDAIDLTEPEKAAPEPPAAPDWKNAPRERRYGFMFGFQAGAALGNASGFPNDSLKIDRDEFRTTTDVGIGGIGSAWIGGALIDWLSFGLGGSFEKMAAGDDTIDAFAMIFHIEAFPAYALGGEWRELGVQTEMGVGFASVDAPNPDDPALIETGGASRIGLGFFYEGFRLWQISTGPALGADVVWSPSGRVASGWLGWRTALYSGP